MPELALDEAALRERVEQDSLRLFLVHLRGSVLALLVLIAGMVLAWQDYAPLNWRLAWGAAASLACLGQGWFGWRLERSPDFAAAVPRWLPWLHASVLASSIVWGLVPLMVSQGEAAELPLLLACAFNVSIVFAGAHAPGTPGLVLSLSLPVSVLGTLTVASRSGHALHALACGLLFALVSLYGYRMQVAIRDTLVARRSAEALGEALRAQQQLVHEAERERSLLVERQRLMRDMHDGVGSTLIAMLRMSESGGASAPAMAELLRTAIEDLRLTIDSLEPLEHDLATLLATLRTRVGRRLEAAGLKLEWAVADMPPLPWLEPTQALQVLRLVQEAVTNVVKHARAQTLGVSARPDGDALEVCITDDGCGFDPGSAAVGKGLASMRQRAQALGATLHWHSAPGQGTRVSLQLPLRPAVSGVPPARAA